MSEDVRKIMLNCVTKVTKCNNSGLVLNHPVLKKSIIRNRTYVQKCCESDPQLYGPMAFCNFLGHIIANFTYIL